LSDDLVSFSPRGPLAVHIDGELDTVIGVRIDDDLITELYAVRNQAKLSHMGHGTSLRR
jgi:hypothetical protein